jgi:organic radical activating enzyme
MMIVTIVIMTLVLLVKASESDCMKIIENLPKRVDRLILSGGEPLADIKLIIFYMDKVRKSIRTPFKSCCKPMGIY